MEWSESVSLGVGQLRGFTAGYAAKVEYGLNQVELRVRPLNYLSLYTWWQEYLPSPWKSTPQVRDLVYNEWEKRKGESQGKPHGVGSEGGS